MNDLRSRLEAPLVLTASSRRIDGATLPSTEVPRNAKMAQEGSGALVCLGAP